MQPQHPTQPASGPPVSPAPQPYHAGPHPPQPAAYQPQLYQAPISPAVYPTSPAIYPPAYGHPQPVMVIQGPPTSGTAVASMVIGILGALGGWCMFAIPCLIAVILGHASLSDIKRTGKGGKGMAVAGLVLGYVFGAPFGILAVMMLLGAVSAPFTSGTSTGP